MKISTFLFFCCLVNIFAAPTYSQSTKISLHLKDATIEDVLNKIEDASEFYFLYNSKLIDVTRKVDINADKEPIKDILSEILDKDTKFIVYDRQIIITPDDVSSVASAMQQLKITGTVTGKDGNPLPGVNIVVTGTTMGTLTDIAGKYSLDIPQGAKSLTFTFIGMEQQEIKIGGSTLINVTMSESAIGLEEVVVVGYGTTSKRKMVGAVSTVDTKTMEQLPFSNVSQALQGKVPGLILENTGGAPGSIPSLSIRGGGKPLFVIDGVVIDEGDNFSFSSLNMDDIASMSFLKDASSTAVYGSRAGNGIVLITTKRGKEGTMKLNYSANYQLSRPTVMPEKLNSYEFAMIQNQAIKYDGGTTPAYTQEQLDKYKNHTDLVNYPDNNWYDLTLNKYAPEQRHNLSLTGGDKKTNYFVSLGYYDQKGLYKSNVTDLTRINLRSNVTTNFDKIGLDVSANISASLENRTEPGNYDGSVWQGILHTSPNVPAYNPDGTYAAVLGMPLAYSDKRAGYIKPREKYINTQLVANWKIPGIRGLKVGVMGNYHADDSFWKQWLLTAPQYNPDGTIYPVPLPKLNSSAGYNKKIDFETNLSYRNTFGKHGIDLTLVHTMSKGDGENVSAFRQNYISGAVDQIFAGPAAGKDNGGTGFSNANEGYVGRLTYDYSAKYILEYSFRYDGNDNFAPAKRWGFFPSVSGAWVVSDEGFMKTLNESNILNLLKLRASYGKTGISEGVIRLGYLPVYNLNPNAYTIGNSLVTGFSEGPLVDPNSLTWFTRTSQNYGFNFATLKNRIEGSFDIFSYRTSGYLMSPKNQYTTPLGKDLPQIASNSVQRRAGIEITLSYKGQRNNFSYEVGVNYTRFNQLWETLASEDSATLRNPYTRQTHQTDYWITPAGFSTPELTTFYLSDGLYQGKDDILNSPRRLASTDTKGGDIKYQDTNGDGKIDANDLRRIGSPSFPHANYGFYINMKYKGWYLNSLFQGTGNRYVYFDVEYQRTEGKDLTMKFQQNYWSPENPNALLPRITNSAGRNGNNNRQPSDFWLKNSKYFRLKTLQIGYDLKMSVMKNISSISACRVVLSGTNLFTISDVTKYFDPEDNTGNGSIYPVQKTYSIGLNVEF